MYDPPFFSLIVQHQHIRFLSAFLFFFCDLCCHSKATWVDREGSVSYVDGDIQMSPCSHLQSQLSPPHLATYCSNREQRPGHLRKKKHVVWLCVGVMFILCLLLDIGFGLCFGFICLCCNKLVSDCWHESLSTLIRVFTQLRDCNMGSISINHSKVWK